MDNRPAGVPGPQPQIRRQKDLRHDGVHPPWLRLWLVGGVLWLGLPLAASAWSAASEATPHTQGTGAPVRQPAIAAAWEALRLATRLHGPSHPDTVPALISLADACTEAGDVAQAEPLLERAWRILQQNPQQHMPHIFSLQEKRLLNPYGRGHFSQVLTQGEAWLQTAAALAPNHPALLRIRHLLAYAHIGLARQQGGEVAHRSEAAAHLEQALAQLNQPSHPMTDGVAEVYLLQA
ncbi:MAG: tetratricopeptide repeat protein, partial [Magnetococcales bacterium]|nr:tetratricopeptide repeat protein [Magnetococcales bacterium]